MFNHNSVFYDYLLELTEHVHKLDNGEIDRNGDGFIDLQRLECRIINAYSNGYFGSMDKCALMDIVKHCRRDYRLLLGLDR